MSGRATLWLSLALLLVLGGTLAPWAAAQEPKLEFRRVFVPADRVDDWPGIFDHLAGRRWQYFPVKPQEFEQLIRTVQDAAGAAPRTTGTRIRQATYSAKLVGDQLTEGRAVWNIERPGDTLAVLPLEPCRLAIQQARWANNQPAWIGLDSQQQPALLVEQQGTVTCDWNLQGRRAGAEQIDFMLQLPRCPLATFQLELPAGQIPTVSAGWVLEGQPVENSDARRWQIELGGHAQVQLTIGPGEQPADVRNLTLVRENFTYDFSLRGVDLSARFDLENFRGNLNQLQIALDPGIRLLAAREGDTTLTWTDASETTVPAPDAVRTLTLHLPEGKPGSPRIVSLRATFPLVLDKPFSLPAIRPLGVLWQEGRATLRIPSPLLLQQLTPTRTENQLTCRQIEASPLPSPAEGESVVIEFYSEQAQVNLSLVHREQTLRIATGISILASQDQLLARCVADLQALEGKRFSVEADVPSRWLIDSVTCEPAEALTDWRMKPGDATHNRLELQLAQALTPARPLRMIVQARWLRPAVGDPVPLEDLLPLRWEEPSEQTTWLAAKGVGPYRLDLQGNELNWLDPQQQDRPWGNRISEPRPEWLVALGREPVQAVAVLQRERPRFTVKSHLEWTLSATSLWETSHWQGHAEPGRPIERLNIGLPIRQAEPPNWSVDGLHTDTRWTARPLAEPPANAAGGARQWWQITFVPPVTEQVSVRATRVGPLAGIEGRLELPLLPDATTQQGEVIVRVTEPIPVQLENQGLQAIPIPSTTGPGQPQAIAAYRFEATAERDATLTAAVQFIPQPSGAAPSLVLWNARLTSHYETSGAAQHWLAYQVEHLGAVPLSLTLPSDVTVTGVWIEATRVAADRPRAGGDDRSELQLTEEQKTRVAAERQETSLIVTLPAERRFSTVRLAYRQKATPLGVWSQLAPPLPQTEPAAIETTWQVALPNEYALAAPATGWESSAWPDPNWTERLFGPWGRSRLSGSLWQPATWTRGVGFDPEQDRGAALAARFHAEFERQLPEALPGNLSWSELLHDVLAADAELSVIELRVDRVALAAAGITAERAVLLPADTEPMQALGPRPASTITLGRWGLTVVATPAGLFLTTTAMAEAHASEWVPLQAGPDHWTAVPPWQLQPLDLASESPRWLPLGTWNLAPQTRWPVANLDLPAGSVAPTLADWHWSTVNLHATVAAPPAVLALQRNVHDTWCLAVAFAALALACGWPARWSRSAWCALGILGATALAVPAWLIPCASAAMLGALCGCAGRLLWSTPTTTTASNALVPSSRRGPALVRLLLIIGTLVWAGHGTGFVVHAQPPMPPVGPANPPAAAPAFGPQPAASTAAPAGEAPLVYPVFVPVDAEQKPLAADRRGEYMVPLELYRELLRRADRLRAVPQGWFCGPALYQGNVSWDPESRRFVIPQLTVTLQLRSFGDNIRAFIPLAPDGLMVLPETATLDDRPAAVSWDAVRRGVQVMLPTPGTSTLKLVLAPQAKLTEQGSGWELSIPPLLSAQLELRLGADAPVVEVPSAIGITELVQRQQVLRADLGPTDKLTVQWRDDDPAGRIAPQLKIDQLLWLKVLPGSVVVDVRLKCRVVEGVARYLYFATDPRYELIRPWQAPQLRTHQVRELPGSSRTHILHFARPMTGEFVVEGSFLLKGISGVGNLRLPRLETVGVERPRQWLAVSVDRSLEVTLPAGAEVPTAQFATAWGTGELKPTVLKVFDLQTADATWWKLATRPREPIKTASQSLTVTVGRERIDVQLQAEVVTSEAPSLQHQLRTPAGLQVQDVLLTDLHTSRPVRWSRLEDGRLTVFLPQPAHGPQLLNVRGWLPLQLPAHLSLPAIELDRVRNTRLRLIVQRRPDVLVEVSGVTGLKADATIDSKPTADRLQVVASYEALAEPGSSLPNPGFTGSLTCRANRPQLQGIQLVSLSRLNSRWYAQLELQLQQVLQGSLDQLVLEVPDSWTGPFKVLPAMSQELRRTGSPGTQWLVLRPERPLSVETPVVIRGELNIPPGAPVRLPVLQPRDIKGLRTYVLLPEQVDQQQVLWDVFGLKESPPPAALLSHLPNHYQVFEVTNRRYGATLRNQGQALRSPKVWLADIRIQPRRDRSYVGVANFAVESAGLPSCRIVFPTGCLPRLFTLDGQPVAAVASEDGAWVVPLEPTQYPHAVEVLFGGTLPPDYWHAGQGLLVTPWIDVLPVERTTWAISGVSPDAQLAGAPAVSRLALDTAQLEALAPFINLAHDSARDEPASETRTWYRPWQTQLAELQRQMELNTALNPQSEWAEAAQVQLRKVQALQQGWQVAARVSAEPESTAAAATSLQQVAQTQLVTRWATFRQADQPLAAGQYPQARRVLPVYDPLQARLPTLERSLLAAVWALGWCLCGWWLFPSPTTQWLWNWRFAWGIALGLLSTLALDPPAIGLVLALISAGLLLRQGRQARQRNSLRLATR